MRVKLGLDSVNPRDPENLKRLSEILDLHEAYSNRLNDVIRCWRSTSGFECPKTR